MHTINKSLGFLFALSRFNALLTRKLDAGLGGVSFTEFQILYFLDQAGSEKVRRVDLAELIGLTPSGVTRLLLPMEKIGLVKRVSDPSDARVSYVQIARGGKQKFEEACERVELFIGERFEPARLKKLAELASELEAARI